LTADSRACPKALGSGLTSYELHIDLQGDAPTALIPVLVTGIQPTRVCAAGETLFTPRTWTGWIPVTSTGMRGKHRKTTFQQSALEKAASTLAWQLFGK
jgi:hypothetical protein